MLTIDHAMAEFFVHFDTLPMSEQQAIREAIRSAIRRDTIAEIPDALLPLHPLLSALWGEWQDTLEAEAWAAVVKTIFLKSELVGAGDAKTL